MQPKKTNLPARVEAISAPPRSSLTTTGLRFFTGFQRPSAQALANKRIHDELLQLLLQVVAASSHGFEQIHADLEGWPQPARILWTHTRQGYVPDATAWAWLGMSEYLFEVETAETLSLEHTRNQCELFSAYARVHGAEFVLVVPLGLQARAARQLASWGITAQVW